MKYWLDTEFIENGKTIELISIGLVCEDGREFYAISNEFDPGKANEWVKENVLPYIQAEKDKTLFKTKAEIRQALLHFVADDRPEFIGYYCAYDWVLLCQLYGSMMQLPKHFPKYCNDIKTYMDLTQVFTKDLPFKNDQAHNALADARWHKQIYDFVMQYIQ
jgi:hypothetical protein